MAMLSPLAGLLKVKDKPTEISETTGTSNDNTIKCWGYEYDYKLPQEFHRSIDPNSHWAKECAKDYQRVTDETIIKAMKNKA